MKPHPECGFRAIFLKEVTDMKTKSVLKDFAIITFGTVLAAASIYFFMLPSKVAVGSASALAMVLGNVIPLPVSLLTLAINVILLILGFILIGPSFGIKTVYAATLLPVTLGVFEVLFPNFVSFTNDPLLDVLCYVLIVGIAMAILFSRNASSGGVDILAKILNKFLHIELGKAGAICGTAIALSSVFFYDTKTVVVSVLATYFGGVIVDHFIFGLDLKRRVCVISPKIDEISAFILHELHSGASINEIIGAYDNTVRKEIITIVDKQEYRRLMDFIRRVDPAAFVTVYSVGEMRYQPKNRG